MRRSSTRPTPRRAPTRITCARSPTYGSRRRTRRSSRCNGTSTATAWTRAPRQRPTRVGCITAISRCSAGRRAWSCRSRRRFGARAVRRRRRRQLFPLRLLHDRAELRDDLEGVALAGEVLELRELRLEPGRIDGGPREPQDLRVVAPGDRLVLAPQLLVQLLARTRADDLDRDVAR